MQSPGNLSNDLSQVDDDLSQVQTDLDQVKNDNSTLSTNASDGADQSTLCYVVSVEYQDANTTVSEANTMVSYVESAGTPDLGQDYDAMKVAPADWASYWKAQHALPTYHPTTPIPPLATSLPARSP